MYTIQYRYTPGAVLLTCIRFDDRKLTGHFRVYANSFSEIDVSISCFRNSEKQLTKTDTKK